MARPLRISFPGAFYHVTSIGNEQKAVFKNKRDQEQFLSYLESATEGYHALIHAYCLMNNYYHSYSRRLRPICLRLCATSTAPIPPTSTANGHAAAIFFKVATKRFWRIRMLTPRSFRATSISTRCTRIWSKPQAIPGRATTLESEKRRRLTGCCAISSWLISASKRQGHRKSTVIS